MKERMRRQTARNADTDTMIEIAKTETGTEGARER